MISESRSHAPHMARALAMACMAMDDGEPPFGVVIVDAQGNEVAATHDRVNSSGDMTAHAEVLAVREACQRLGASLSGCVLYTSCEPCPMCFTAAWLAGIDAVVFAATMAEVHAILGDAQRELRVTAEHMNELAPEPITVVPGVARDESLALFKRWARQLS